MIVKSGKKERVFNNKLLIGFKKIKKNFTFFLFTFNLFTLVIFTGLVLVKPDLIKNGFKKVYNVVYSKNYLHYPEVFLKYLTSQFVVADYVQIDINTNPRHHSSPDPLIFS